MEHKFKVGDKVTSDSYKVWEGKPLYVVGVGVGGVIFCSPHNRLHPKHNVDTGSLLFHKDNLKLVEQQEHTTTTKENFITVGETYKALDNRQWTCIFVDGDNAWCKAGKDNIAYVFKTGGTPVSLSIEPEVYTLVPNKTVVEVFSGYNGNLSVWGAYKDPNDTHKITFELDSSGEPVVDSIKMETLEKDNSDA